MGDDYILTLRRRFYPFRRRVGDVGDILLRSHQMYTITGWLYKIANDNKSAHVLSRTRELRTVDKHCWEITQPLDGFRDERLSSRLMLH